MARWTAFLVSAALLVSLTVPAPAQTPNAADQYTQALKDAHLEELQGDDLNFILNSGYRPKVVVDKGLDDNRKAFGELLAGSRLQKCRFVPDVGVLDKNVAPYDQLRGLALLSMVNGLRLYSQGKTDEGLDYMLAAIRVGLHMQQDKIMTARTEGLNLQLAAYTVVVVFLQREHPASALLKKHMADAQALLAMQVPFAKTIRTEKAWVGASITDLSKPGSTNRAFQGLTASQTKQAVAMAQDRANQLYSQLERMAASTDFQSMQTTESAFAKKYNRKDENTSVPSLVASRLLEILVPDFSHAWQDAQVGRVELGALPALFALKACQFDKHAFPTKLTALVPAYLKVLPTDPFGTGPLKYKSAGKECLVYSVGPDGHDDGGKAELVDYAKTRGKDIILKLR